MNIIKILGLLILIIINISSANDQNNSKNKIEGIGLIRNRTHVDKYYKIYHEGNYNRYVYKGNYYLNREKLLTLDENLV